jgi:RNA polymerase sigma factor (sigma-70 family)
MHLRPAEIVDHLCSLARSSGQPPDAVLLERFVARRDQPSFAPLVERHGRMVLGLCHRVLGHAQDAEDAFQATFLALARGAHRIRRPESLAAWLHGVALRLARKARARRRRPVPLLNEPPAPPCHPLAELSLREVLAALDEELNRLPERDRLPLVLCYLEGRTREEAARLLGWTAGALHGRLERGRKRLYRRMRGRGLELPAVLLPAATEGAVPAALEATTVSASAAFTRGAAPAGASPRAVAWALEAGRPLLSGRARLLALVLTLTALAAAATVPAFPARVAPPDTGPRPAAPSRAPEWARDALPAGAVARLGTPRFRHGAEVVALAFAPDGKGVAAAGGDGLVRLWDVPAGRERHAWVRDRGRWRSLAGLTRADRAAVLGRCLHYTEGLAVSFSANGKLLGLVAAPDREAVVCDPASGRIVRGVKLAGRGRALALSPDGKALACEIDTGPHSAVALHDLETGRELWQRRGPGSGGHLSFLPDGRTVAWASHARRGGRHRILWWDRRTGAERSPPSLGGNLLLALARDGRLAVCLGEGDALGLWDVTAGREQRRLGKARGARAAAFAPDGEGLAVVGPATSPRSLQPSEVRLWHVPSGREVGRLKADFASPPHVLFSPDGKVVATAGGDQVIRLFRADTGAPLPAPEGHDGSVLALAVAPDARHAATRDREGGLWLWGLADGKARWRAADWGRALCFSRDGRLISASFSSPARAWDVPTGRELPRKGRPAVAVALGLAPDGRALAAQGLPDQLQLGEAETGRVIWQVPGPPPALSWAAVSPDGQRVAFANEKGSILLAEACRPGRPQPFAEGAPVVRGRQGARWRDDDMVYGLAFSPDGQGLASVRRSDGVSLWEVSTRAVRLSVLPPPGDRMSLALGPGGRLLATGGLDASVRLWDLFTGRELCRFTGHEGVVCTLAFTPDGRRLLSGSSDGTVLVWDVSRAVGPAERRSLPAPRREALWSRLGGHDAREGWQAVAAFARADAPAVAWLLERLRRLAPPVELARVDALIGEVGADTFAVRERATRELERLGDAAGPALRARLQEGPSLELRRRIEQLLRRPPAPGPNQLRAQRGVEALEHSGSAAAREALAELARWLPEAKAAHQRLSRRAPRR